MNVITGIRPRCEVIPLLSRDPRTLASAWSLTDSPFAIAKQVCTRSGLPTASTCLDLLNRLARTHARPSAHRYVGGLNRSMANGRAASSRVEWPAAPSRASYEKSPVLRRARGREHASVSASSSGSLSLSLSLSPLSHIQRSTPRAHEQVATSSRSAPNTEGTSGDKHPRQLLAERPRVQSRWSGIPSTRRKQDDDEYCRTR